RAERKPTLLGSRKRRSLSRYTKRFSSVLRCGSEKHWIGGAWKTSSHRGSARTDEPGSSGNHVSALAEEQPRRSLSLVIKVSIVIAVIAINLLIYANLAYFKSDVPFDEDQ
ncbi:hypothetical protein MRX96_043789, partial [Rhipicephalus microplus]